MPTNKLFQKIMTDEKPEISFVKDIQLMMHGLGDSPQPLVATAELLEQIIVKQLVSILAQAKAVANMRSSRDSPSTNDMVAPEDILFLMRKNLVGLKRLINYLGLKDEKQTLNKTLSSEGEVEECGERVTAGATWSQSRKSYCLERLGRLGIEESELLATDDVIKRERQARADVYTQHLSSTEYENYYSARRASFGAASMSCRKFVAWLKQHGGVQEPPPAVIEILVYLAKETLSQIIDMVLTLREQAPRQYIGEPPSITVKEIQEVVRLCWTPQSFTLGILSRDVPAYANTRLLVV